MKKHERCPLCWSWSCLKLMPSTCWWIFWPDWLQSPQSKPAVILFVFCIHTVCMLHDSVVVTPYSETTALLKSIPTFTPPLLRQMKRKWNFSCYSERISVAQKVKSSCCILQGDYTLCSSGNTEIQTEEWKTKWSTGWSLPKTNDQITH